MFNTSTFLQVCEFSLKILKKIESIGLIKIQRVQLKKNLPLLHPDL